MWKLTLKFLSMLRANQGILSLALTFIAIIVAVWATHVSIRQLQSAENASELNSVSTILNVYNSPKARYYDTLIQYVDRCEVPDQAQPSSDDESTCSAMFVLVSASLWDYLNAIEAACNIYLYDLLDEQRREFISGYVMEDISLLTFGGYDEESGQVGADFSNADSINIPWLKPNLEPSDEQYQYEATRACLEEWDIVLESFSIGG